MRGLLFIVLLSGCSAIVDTSDLSGGAPRDAGLPPGCQRDLCADDTLVVKLAGIAPCTTETTDKLGCRAKIAEACRALDACCYRGGYGPLDFPNADEATIVCLFEDAYTAPITELTSASSKCLSTALASRDCDAAAHLSAKKRGEGTAILQSVSGDNATLIAIGMDSLDVQTLPWSELTMLNAACTPANIDKQACNTAAQRRCANDSYTAGYGPVASTATEVTIVCIL